MGIGAGNRVRTGDLNLGKVALYQLSYSRVSVRVSTAVVAGTGEAGRPPCNLGKVALYQLSYSRVSMRVSTAVVAGTGEVFGLMSGVP